MNLLRTERDTLDLYLPGLDKYLSEIPLQDLEKPGNGALGKFRELGGPALLVPAEYGGKGASWLDAVRIQRAVGSRSPSLAVATTMHHFSVASLVELTAAGNGFEWAMLTAIAEKSWLLSSAFAEGTHGQHILTPTMRGVPAVGGITVSGVKKPCSLTWSMNLMSASVAVADPATGTDRLAVVLIPAESPGIERARFWRTTALAGAESDQVTLTEVFVPDALIFYPQNGESIRWSGACENMLITGQGVLTWYENGRISGRDEGQFKNGELSGHGRIFFEDGASFEGEFPGVGILTAPDGKRVRAQSVKEPTGWDIEEILENPPV